MTPANSGDKARPSPCFAATKNRNPPRLHTYDVKGYISKCWMEFRVKAVNADAAISLGHERGMRVSECVEVKKKRK